MNEWETFGLLTCINRAMFIIHYIITQKHLLVTDIIIHYKVLLCLGQRLDNQSIEWTHITHTHTAVTRTLLQGCALICGNLNSV